MNNDRVEVAFCWSASADFLGGEEIGPTAFMALIQPGNRDHRTPVVLSFAKNQGVPLRDDREELSPRTFLRIFLKIKKVPKRNRRGDLGGLLRHRHAASHPRDTRRFVTASQSARSPSTVAAPGVRK